MRAKDWRGGGEGLQQRTAVYAYLVPHNRKHYCHKDEPSHSLGHQNSEGKEANNGEEPCRPLAHLRYAHTATTPSACAAHELRAQQGRSRTLHIQAIVPSSIANGDDMYDQAHDT